MEKISSQGTVLKALWEPTPEGVSQTNLSDYLDWLLKHRNLSFFNYEELWHWSTDHPGDFWRSIADYFQVHFYSQERETLTSLSMPGFRWFPGAMVNYAEHALRQKDSDGAAILYEAEILEGNHQERIISRKELYRQVSWLAHELRQRGVQKGDCVAGFLPHIPETIAAFLATASIGAIWSNCPAEIGSRGVLDRLSQIHPKVLLASISYRYGGKRHPHLKTVQEIVAGLPTLKHLIVVPSSSDEKWNGEGLSPEVTFHRWNDLVSSKLPPPLVFEPVPFDHPLWILYSSGTTGKPKAIVHGHGGILLEHLKALSLHLDLRAGERFFWYTTSGWMMWNFLISGLLLPGVTVVIYDGSPKYPDFQVLWDFVERQGIHYFGASAPYFVACIKAGLIPRDRFSFRNLRGMGSTGAPLPAEAFEWIYQNVKEDLILGSVSGGTDICSAFILSNPHHPVYAGQLQSLGLGAKIEAWSENRKPLLGEVGELVLTVPFPSMPVFLWGDEKNARLKSSYYERFPGVWSHGDWIELESPAGPCVIHGRSDATLNRGGVRMGTSEFYTIVEEIPEIMEALVLDMGGFGREDQLVLFVALTPENDFTESLKNKICLKLKTEASPRHLPDVIYHVPEIPRTLNGKKVEVPIKRILMGLPVEEAIQVSTLANPESLKPFLDWVPLFSKTSKENKKE
ncbi:MAG: acetoacetate--CoA ligase [Verrucomicrobiota bacterium]